MELPLTEAEAATVTPIWFPRVDLAPAREPVSESLLEAAAALAFGPEIAHRSFMQWCMQVRLDPEKPTSYRLNRILPWAVAANGGRYLACAQGGGLA